MHWEPYSIEDAVNAVSEWNYELLQEAEAAVSNAEDMIDFSNKKSYLNTLREDEKILDGTGYLPYTNKIRSLPISSISFLILHAGCMLISVYTLSYLCNISIISDVLKAARAVSNIVVGKEIKFLFRYQRILR